MIYEASNDNQYGYFIYIWRKHMNVCYNLWTDLRGSSILQWFSALIDINNQIYETSFNLHQAGQSKSRIHESCMSEEGIDVSDFFI